MSTIKETGKLYYKNIAGVLFVAAVCFCLAFVAHLLSHQNNLSVVWASLSAACSLFGFVFLKKCKT
jgi:exosortase/archaeosortase